MRVLLFKMRRAEEVVADAGGRYHPGNGGNADNAGNGDGPHQEAGATGAITASTRAGNGPAPPHQEAEAAPITAISSITAITGSGTVLPAGTAAAGDQGTARAARLPGGCEESGCPHPGIPAGDLGDGRLRCAEHHLAWRRRERAAAPPGPPEREQGEV